MNFPKPAPRATPRETTPHADYVKGTIQIRPQRIDIFSARCMAARRLAFSLANATSREISRFINLAIHFADC